MEKTGTEWTCQKTEKHKALTIQDLVDDAQDAGTVQVREDKLCQPQ